VHLTWTAPECATPCTPALYQYDAGILTDGISINPGFYTVIQLGNYFPVDPATTTGVVKSFDMMFSSNSSSSSQSCVIYLYDVGYNLIGQSAPFINGPTNPWPSGTWINVPVDDIPYTGPFYALVDYSVTSTPYKNFFLWDGVTPQVLPDGLGFANADGTFSSTVSLFGLSSPSTFLQRANVCFNGKDGKDVLTTIDPSKLPVSKKVTPNPGAAINLGANVNGQAGQAGQPPVHQTTAPVSPSLQGYNVWRTDLTGLGTYLKLNTLPVPTTAYTDIIPLVGWGIYNYYVTAIFNDTIPNTFLCESPGSDTVTVQFPAVGIQEIGNGQISVYPNPANDVVNIVSTNDIKTIEVLNYIGQMIYTNKNVSLKKVELNVSSFKAGVYFVKITTTSGIKTTKITVTH
jgi:hypothetical protein